MSVPNRSLAYSGHSCCVVIQPKSVVKQWYGCEVFFSWQKKRVRILAQVSYDTFFKGVALFRMRCSSSPQAHEVFVSLQMSSLLRYANRKGRRC